MSGDFLTWIPFPSMVTPIHSTSPLTSVVFLALEPAERIGPLWQRWCRGPSAVLAHATHAATQVRAATVAVAKGGGGLEECHQFLAWSKQM